jgi:hypothetical protein
VNDILNIGFIKNVLDSFVDFADSVEGFESGLDTFADEELRGLFNVDENKE